MKNTFLYLFCSLSIGMFSQLHLAWNNQNENFSLLKKHKKIKVEFSQDSLVIVYSSLDPFFKDTVHISTYHNIIKNSFTSAFNKEGKINISDSKNDTNIVYTIKITPIKFYGQKIYHSESFSEHGSSPAMTSIYFKGDYHIELFNSKNLKSPLRSFTLTNLTNPGPKCRYQTNYNPRKKLQVRCVPYKKTVLINSKRAGKESAKYINKMIKSSE